MRPEVDSKPETTGICVLPFYLASCLRLRYGIQQFQNEAMTGTHTQNPIYSRITMALMEDTGWYMPNYEMADNLKWGKGMGCDFALESCLSWMEKRQSQGKSIHPFCNKVKRDPLETECTDDRSSVALCNLVKHVNELPPHFQVSILLT